MKLVVYAICKDQAGYVSRWMDSMSEADQVVVLDLGSEDGSAQLLQERGAQVEVSRVEPFRFDEARNRSLALVPEDAQLCVCTDLDQVFAPGWRSGLERAWSPEFARVRYPYFRPFSGEEQNGLTVWGDNIHVRHGFRWEGAALEQLRWAGGQPPAAQARGVRLAWQPEPEQGETLRLSVLEQAAGQPNCDWATLYALGWEYLFCGAWVQARSLLEDCLSSCALGELRCGCLRGLARCWEQLGQPEQALSRLLCACGECPGRREPWIDLAQACYRREDWHGVLFGVRRALAITYCPEGQPGEPEAWGETPYDLAAIALYYLGDYRRALAMGEEALKRSPMDARLRENLRLIRQRTQK